MRGRTILYFALASISLGGCSQGASKGEAQLTPAQACLQTLDPATGVDACKTAIAADQNNPALRRRMGLLRLKSHALSAARQSYQVAIDLDPNYQPDAQFGLGLTLEAIGEPGANLRKLDAVKHDPAVVDRFRKDGISEPDLMTFDTAPRIVGGASPAADKLLIPKQPLRQGLSVDVRCLVGLNRRLHDCIVTTPLTPDQAVFGEAAKKILAATHVEPARDKDAPVADAPIVMTYVFWPQGQG
jgi:hypothetical protein